MAESSFNLLIKEITEALQLKADMEKERCLTKALADSHASGVNNLNKVKKLGSTFAASLRKSKSEALKSNRERAESLLKDAHAALASGTLDPYRTDLLKQKIKVLERAMAGVK